MPLDDFLYAPRPGYFRRGLSHIYARLHARRLERYTQGRQQAYRPAARVVSVGNLSVGGTGKTPTAIYIARLALERGHRVAVLSRGYKGAAKKPVNVVSDGARVLLGPASCGDEPHMMALALPGVVVLTAKKRADAARLAVERFGADFIVLDDAFQHFQVARDINLLLLDATEPFGNGYLLPAGPLREPASAVTRATALLLTRFEENHDCLSALEQLRRAWPDKPIFTARHAPAGLTSLFYREEKPLEYLRGKRVAAFCALARPEQFIRQVESLGAEVVRFKKWKDHYSPRKSDILELAAKIDQAGAELAVTTAKDAVKLGGWKPEEWGVPMEVCALNIKLEPTRGEDEFARMLFSV